MVAFNGGNFTAAVFASSTLLDWERVEIYPKRLNLDCFVLGSELASECAALGAGDSLHVFVPLHGGVCVCGVGTCLDCRWVAAKSGASVKSDRPDDNFYDLGSFCVLDANLFRFALISKGLSNLDTALQCSVFAVLVAPVGAQLGLEKF